MGRLLRCGAEMNGSCRTTRLYAVTRIAVILPAYDVSGIIAEQRFRRHVALSTDTAGESGVLDAHATNFSRIRCVANDHPGRVAGRMRGWKRAIRRQSNSDPYGYHHKRTAHCDAVLRQWQGLSTSHR